jgi:hypothetical protein
MTKKVSIEQFLTWAFTQELCKIGSGNGGGSFVSGSSWQMISEYSALGTMIDRSPNHFGVIPDFIMAQSDPHPDAVEAGNAVRQLADRGGFEIGDGWNPFPEWHDERGLIAREVAAFLEMVRIKRDVLHGKHVVNLVISRAILGSCPDWTAERPGEQVVTINGKPAWFVIAKGRDSLRRSYTYEVDGFDRRKQKPLKGAYQKYELDAPLRGAILSRLEWQLWQDALETLHNALSGRLLSNDLLPFRPIRAPWAKFISSAASSQVIEKA